MAEPLLNLGDIGLVRIHYRGRKGLRSPESFPLVITSDRAAEYAFRFNRRKSLHLEQPMFDAFIGRITKQAAAA
jgi:hypothetical protein